MKKSRMKTLVIIMCVLSVTTVYGFHVKRAQAFHQNIIECNEELGEEVTALRVDTFTCALKKDGLVLDENGKIRKTEGLQLIVDCISNVFDIARAEDLYLKCYKDAFKRNEINEEKTKKVIKCSLPIIFFFENPSELSA